MMRILFIQSIGGCRLNSTALSACFYRKVIEGINFSSTVTKGLLIASMDTDFQAIYVIFSNSKKKDHQNVIFMV